MTSCNALGSYPRTTIIVFHGTYQRQGGPCSESEGLVQSNRVQFIVYDGLVGHRGRLGTLLLVVIHILNFESTIFLVRVCRRLVDCAGDTEIEVVGPLRWLIN